MRIKIKCKNPDCCIVNNNNNGCTTCGGYGYVLYQVKCDMCGTPYWTRGLQGTTMYEGKEIRMFDGMRMIIKNYKLICHNCRKEDK